MPSTRKCFCQDRTRDLEVESQPSDDGCKWQNGCACSCCKPVSRTIGNSRGPSRHPTCHLDATTVESVSRNMLNPVHRLTTRSTPRLRQRTTTWSVTSAHRQNQRLRRRRGHVCSPARRYKVGNMHVHLAREETLLLLPPFSMNTEAVDGDGLMRTSHEGARVESEPPDQQEATGP